MWDFISQRIKFGPNHKRKASPSLEKMRARAMMMKKAAAQLRMVAAPGTLVPAGETDVHLVLNDFTEKGIRLFSPESMEIGQTVALVMQAPRTFYVRAKVLACHRLVYDQRVIQANPIPWRMVLSFEFGSESERENARQMYREIQLLLRDPSVAQTA